jgi:hypothetical protein
MHAFVFKEESEVLPEVELHMRNEDGLIEQELGKLHYIFWPFFFD